MKYILALFVIACLIVPADVCASERTVPAIASVVRDVILQNLAYNAPEYTVRLEEARIDAGLRDLEKAGLVRELYRYSTDCRGQRAFVVLTQKGQKLAAELGWLLEDGVLRIPLGGFAYVDGTSKVNRSTDRPRSLTFKYRFEPSLNFAYLLRIGRGPDWAPRSEAEIKIRHVYSRTVQLRNDGGRLYLDEHWAPEVYTHC